MEDKVIEKVNEKIQHILDEDINTNNLDHLYKLSKIKYYTEEGKNMNNYGYGNYGNYRGRSAGYDAYGRDDYRTHEMYGRRGYDMKYRGHDYLDRIYDNYGRYMEGRERYGANEDTKKSLRYMLESMEDFARMLRDDVSSQEEVDMIRQTAQRIAQM